MDKSILSAKIQEFITSNLNADVSKLALQKNKFPAIDWTTILNQIGAKQKAKNKLPTLVKDKFLKWSQEVETKGLDEVRKMLGMDEFDYLELAHQLGADVVPQLKLLVFVWWLCVPFSWVRFCLCIFLANVWTKNGRIVL